MLGILGGKKNRFVGIDFGTSAIKIVELSHKNQKPYLENYGWFDLTEIMHPEDVKQQKAGSYEKKIKTALFSLLKKLNVNGDEAHVSIPGFSGLVVLIEFPDMKKEEIDKAVEFEAHKYIPTSVEDVSISWEVMPSREVDGEQKNETASKKKIEVLLVAAPKREIEKYSSFFEGADLRMKTIELETFSLTRALVGNEKGNFLIMDMGSRATNIVLVENGAVIINRSVDVGGNDITNSIAESLSISRQRAEIFKKEGKDILNSKENAMFIPAIELLKGEIKRIVTAYGEKNKNSKIDSLVLSGGGCELKGIEKYFQDKLEMKVSRGNPWKSVEYDQKLASNIDKIGASFSVAIGLALRGVEEMHKHG